MLSPFIDEIHMIVGAGQTGAGSMDAGNMLKPQLTGGKLKDWCYYR